MGKLIISQFSNQYDVRRMTEGDVDEILNLCVQNKQYYEFCQADTSREQILNDIRITPPGKQLSDKYYVGYYLNGVLIAIMDLIDGYPDEDIAFIGFFMMNANYQGKGTGSEIITELATYLKDLGFTAIQLGIDKGNPQSTHFWAKNSFLILKEIEQEQGVILYAERKL